ncbi:MAG: glycoside hydrolase family 2 [Bacilli bacterium]|nr:glycoside hydrolase family 2 [Bacilli bacterium]
MEKLFLSEYPRPQLKRNSYISLNGEWGFTISKSEDIPSSFDKKIIVPFSPESKVNHLIDVVSPEDWIFYKKEIKLEKGFLKDKLIIHFTAVDQIADVYFNDEHMIHHVGGFLPFDVVIDKSKVKDINVLIVKVKDLSDSSYLSRGKQKLDRGGIWYSPQSGIYLPVWMESVSEGYIVNIRLTPDIDNRVINIKVISDSKDANVTVENKEHLIKTNEDVSIKINGLKLWSPEEPYLYDIKVKTDKDEISSYFAMRKFSTINDGKHIRLALNNKPYFMKGVLDQGYYFDGGLTPNSYDDFENDIKLVKELGFNTIRKHIKIEPLYWYYLCDKLGIIVWQDFVNGGEKYKFSTIAFPLITGIHHKDNNYSKFARNNARGRKETYQEFVDTISYLYNVPSIGLWTIFNEGWGQFDAKEIYEKLSEIDSTRLFDHASGWHDQGVSDTKSLHVYFKRVKMPKQKHVKGRSVILSECGGYHLKIDGHTFNDTNFGYKKMSSCEELVKTYKEFVDRDILRNIPLGLSAFIYTQLSDVEDELNGFVTYDRKVVKVDTTKIKEINDKINL